MTNDPSKGYIEFVCTGNQGRSPLAELIGHTYFMKEAMLEQYDTRSSGSGVYAIAQDAMPFQFKVKIIRLAQSRGGIYTPVQIEDLTNAIQSENCSALNAYFRIAEQRFVLEERIYRSEAQAYFGISGELKATHDQTMVRDDSRAIFSMARSNHEEVRKIYAGSQVTPFCAVLSAYVLGNSESEIPNSFGQPKEIYFAMVEQLQDLVPRAIEKYLNESRLSRKSASLRAKRS